MSKFAFRAGVVTAALLLTACGGREALKPQTGQSLPPSPAGVATPPTAEELMTPDTQARPTRTDELLRQSEERQDDRFDQPPPR